jgi:carbonic anhydrase/SulP family sulfate permease
MGHTRCGAVTAAVDFACTKADAAKMTGCSHLPPIIKDIQQSIDERSCSLVEKMAPNEKAAFVDDVALRNVLYTTRKILEESPVLRELVQQGRIQVVGALYDIVSGRIDYLAQETAVMSQDSVVGYRISE